MEKQTKQYMDAIKVLSIVLMISGMFMGLTALGLKVFSNESVEYPISIPIIGAMGFLLHQILQSIFQRIADLEGNLINKNDDANQSSEPTLKTPADSVDG